MPPVLVWLILLLLAYGLQFISQFLPDIIIVLWMGVVGGAIGALLTFVAEQFFGKKEKTDGSGA
jgi:energy-converting hydrogenase Eha subunit A